MWTGDVLSTFRVLFNPHGNHMRSHFTGKAIETWDVYIKFRVSTGSSDIRFSARQVGSRALDSRILLKRKFWQAEEKQTEGKLSFLEFSKLGEVSEETTEGGNWHFIMDPLSSFRSLDFHPSNGSALMNFEQWWDLLLICSCHWS